MTDTIKFWDEGMKYQDGYGANPFKELAEFALKILIFPHSNAQVERIFSQLNVTKSKLRDKLCTSTVNAILHVKYGLRRHGKCFKDYKYPAEVLHKIGHMASYHKEQRQEQPQASALAAEPFCSQDIEAIEITLAESECESD